jgi:hypothetical protein
LFAHCDQVVGSGREDWGGRRPLGWELVLVSVGWTPGGGVAFYWVRSGEVTVVWLRMERMDAVHNARGAWVPVHYCIGVTES